VSSVLDPARRAALVGAQLSALVADQAIELVVRPTPLGGGSAALDAQGTAWVLTVDQPERGLGPALAWAIRRDASALHLIAPSATGLLARRAAAITMPVRVSHLEGRSLLDAVAEPLPSSADVPSAHLAFEADIVAGGAIPTVEHGVLSGDVAGLEVCRVVTDPATGAVRLEVGVGAHDREAFQLLHGDRPAVDALGDVVAFVAGHRSGDAPHPLQQLAASRLLRHGLIARPELVGLTGLAAIAPPLPRTNLKDQVPCVAYSEADDTLVVCTTGIDLDAVPFACDALLAHPASACVIAAPARDVIDIQHRLAALVRTPTRVEGVELDRA
jgi:hypothetical protein